MSINSLNIYLHIDYFERQNLEQVPLELQLEFVLKLMQISLEQDNVHECFRLCALRIIDLIISSKLTLSIKENFQIQGDLIRKYFKSLIFIREYEYVLKMQKILMVTIREYYAFVWAKLEVNKQLGDKDEDENEDDLYEHIKTRSDVISDLTSALINTTHFESYNQINFYDDPNNIAKMMRGFIDFGAYTNVNIGFPNSEVEFVEEKTLVKKWVKIIEEFKQSKSKDYSGLNLLQFLGTFEDYNDISFELIDNDTPFSWAIDFLDDNGKNLFENSLDKGNIDLAMKLIDSCDISKVICTFPLNKKSLSNLLNHHNLIHILKCISKNAGKIEQLILKNSASLLNLPIRFEELEKILKGMHKMPGVNENDFYIDFDTNYNIVYAFYQKCKVLPKLGKEIPYFNLLFFCNDRYILDELVKKYSVAVIRDLNEHGYMIGKLISFSPYDKERMIDE